MNSVGQYFKVATEALVQDVMHDILEGIMFVLFRSMEKIIIIRCTGVWHQVAASAAHYEGFILQCRIS